MSERARVLAVDDSLTIRKAFELILKPAGYAVEFAVNGAEGVEKTASFRPDVILLDFILPDMRGTEVCRQLLANPELAGIPVVLVSAKGAEIRQAYQDIVNVVNYITKPFTPDEVTGVIDNVLARITDERMVKARGADAASSDAATDTDADASAGGGESWEAEGAGSGWSNGAEARGGEEAWDDAEVAGDESYGVATSGVSRAAHRDALEVMFETLRAGLEGVYVEEAETPAGAAADHAKSYTELASRLAQQLGETLDHAETGMRYGLCSDGSVRSMGESLLDTYRRVCRLLFRAVAEGAVSSDAVGQHRARVVVACHRESELFEPLVAASSGDWHRFVVSSHFRQLPMMMRLSGATHLIVDAVPGRALSEQLALVRQLPEGRRLRIAAVARPAAVDAPPEDTAALKALGIDAVLDGDDDLGAALRRWILPPADAVAVSTAASGDSPAVEAA